jgi:glycosyltransferase involved in cell wall biosynthesis
MKISVIIPVYNGEKWMEQCLDNILNQTYKSLEIIVIDDGSIDRTAEIAGKYSNVILLRQANSGPSAGRNRAIEAATGDYIHFMDVDDWINIDFYSLMVEAIELTDADMAFGGMVHEAKPYLTRLFTERWLVGTQEDKFRFTGVGTGGYCWRYIVRKSLLIGHNIRFELGRYMADLAFSVRVVGEANKIVTVPGAVYLYKKREGSIINSRDPVKKRKRKEDRSIALTERDRLMLHYGVAHLATDKLLDRKFEYKIFGIHVLQKMIYSNGKTRWYLFGLPIVQVK